MAPLADSVHFRLRQSKALHELGSTNSTVGAHAPVLFPFYSYVASVPRIIASGQDGYCDRAKRALVVNSELAANGRLRVLIHELCHAHDAGHDAYPRAECEVIVDCATHVVCMTPRSRRPGGFDPLHRRIGRAGRRDQRDHPLRGCGSTSSPRRSRQRLPGVLICLC